MFDDIVCDIMHRISTETSTEVFNPRNRLTQFSAATFMTACAALHRKIYSKSARLYKRMILPEIWKMQSLTLDSDMSKILLKRKQLEKWHDNTIMKDGKLYHTIFVESKIGHEVDVMLFREKHVVFVCLFLWRGKSSVVLPHVMTQKAKIDPGHMDHIEISAIQEQVHEGYQRLFLGLRDDIIDRIMNLIGKMRQGISKEGFNVHFVLSGMSTGGNIAVLLGHHLKRYFPFEVDVITFGSQRLATSSQLEQMLVLQPRQTLRVFNSTDVLSKIPPEEAGYYHLDELIKSDKYVGIDLMKECPKEILTAVNRHWWLPRLIFWHLSFIFDSKSHLLISHACSKTS